MSDGAQQKTPKLGRSLASLIGEVEQPAEASAPAQAAPEPQVRSGPAPSEIEIAKISPNPAQPRKHFRDEELAELAASMKDRGVLQAILVRPDPDAEGRYQIVAGERRWRAARRAGLKTIPATVRDLDELELLEIGIVENVQRSDLNPIEEAEAYNALMRRFGRTQENLAESVGKSRAHIANTLRLLNLPEGVRAQVRDGRLSAGHARALLSAPDPDAIAADVVEKGLSVRDVEAMVRKLKAEIEGGEGGPAARGAAPLETKSVDTAALEADLSRVLGLDVVIKHKGESGDKGELRIKYSRLEQLDDVCARLTRKR